MAELLDQWGRPIDIARLREEQAAPSTTGVRQVLGGHPAQGLTPQRLASILLGAESGDARDYLEVAEEMEEKDLHYLSVLGTRKRQISQLDINVEPASDDADDIANADLVRAFVERDALEDETVDVLDAIGKGYSATEIVWDVSERQWMPQRLEWRDPRWFRFRRENGRTLELLSDDGMTEPLAPFKFIRHVHKAKSGLPIRGGLARPVAWWYLFKNYGVKDWVSFVEVYGQPLRVGRYHAGATEEQKTTLLRALANLGTDAAAMIPEGMLIEFVKAEGARANAEIYEKLIAYIDSLISKAVLGQTLTTDVGDSGSRALGDVHNDVRADIERSDCKQLCAALNRDLVRPIVDLNRGPQEAYPKIRIGRAESIDIARVSDSLAKLVPIGFKVSQAQVRALMGMEEPGPDDELLGAPPAPASDPPPDDLPDPDPDPEDEAAAARVCPGCGQARASGAATLDASDAIDVLVEDLIADEGWQEDLDPVVGEALRFVDDVGDLDALRDRLAEALSAMDPTRLADRLARSAFAARLAGEVGAPTHDSEDIGDGSGEP